MIQIKDIDFRYPGSKHLVFRDFSLELKENNIYGLLGKTIITFWRSPSLSSLMFLWARC